MHSPSLAVLSKSALILALSSASLLAKPQDTSSPSSVTKPASFLGYEVGADYKLTTYEKALTYFEKIASESGRMTIQDIGKTAMGRRQVCAFISSADNILNLDRYQEIARKLSLARDVDEEEARELAGQGKAIAWIDVGLHSTECAPSEHAIQLAYDLVTGEDEMTRRIREDVITLLVFANPDGMTLVADWYMEHVGTEFEGARMPWLYQKYIGHDNNRDSFNSSQPETQNINRFQNLEWLPNVAYNHHQTAPFPARIWIPPYGEPTNPNKPAQVIRWENLIGAAMGRAFDANNQPGAISRAGYDAWYPGFLTQIVTTHNVPSILTETALYSLATPHEYTIDDLRGGHADLVKSAFYPSPWEPGWWRIGDAVAYCLTASKAVLDTCSRYRSEMLLSKYRMANNNIERYRNAGPFGWIVPETQHDPTTTARMLDKLTLLGVEVYASEVAFENTGATYPEGTRIVPTSQPFADFVKTMFEKQDYPDLRKYTHLWQGVVGRVDVDSGPLRPYDVAGWTLPLQMGVDTVPLAAAVDFPARRLEGSALREGRIVGVDGPLLLSAGDNSSYIAVNRLLAAGATVSRSRESVSVGEVVLPEGSFVVSDMPNAVAERIVGNTQVTGYRSTTQVATDPLRPLRIGLYQPWTASMDEGWIRFLLESYEFPHVVLHDAEMRTGRLSERVDVIILPSVAGRSLRSGNREGSVPAEYTGGLGEEGVANLRAFVEAGGRLICNGRSSEFAISVFDLPVRNVMQEAQRAGFYSAGSLLRMDFDPTTPGTYGMPRNGTAFFGRDMLFEVDEDAQGVDVIARMSSDSLLLSGYVENDEAARGKITALAIPHGEGRTVLFGFSFHNRAQAHGTFKLLFNALSSVR